MERSHILDGLPIRARFASILVLACCVAFSTLALAETRVTSTTTGIGSPGDLQGSAVAISGDTIAVGAPGVDEGVFRDSGIVAIYRREADWAHEATLAADNAGNDVKFGSAVALSGDVAVVAAPGQSSTTIYTFERSGTSWTQVNRFTRSASGSNSPRLVLSGTTLAMQGGIIFIRAGQGWSEQAALTVDSGSGESFQPSVGLDGDRVAFATSKFTSSSFQYFTYVFLRSGTTWTREVKFEHGLVGFSPIPANLTLSGNDLLVTYGGVAQIWSRASGAWLSQGVLDPLSSTSLSGGIALEGDRAFVGAPGDAIPGAPGTASGTVYVFGRSGGMWSRIGRFAHPRTTDGGLEFGSALAVDGERGVVSATEGFTEAGKSGSAFAIEETAGVWSTGPEFAMGYSHKGEAFGYSVDISSDNLIVGAPVSALPLPYSDGGAYIFTRTGEQWSEQARLLPDADMGSNFGDAVAVIDDFAFVGAPRDSIGGSVHVYERQGNTWPRTARLSMAAPGSMIEFGQSLAAQGDWLAVGSPYGGSSEPGRVVLFDRQGVSWNEHSVVQAVDATAQDRFGQVVAISGDTLVVGALHAEVGIELNAGAAYVFTRSGSLWTQQAKLTGPQPLAGRHLGGAVDVHGDWVAMGSPNLESGASTPGWVYVYTRSGSAWTLAASLQAPAVDEINRARFGSSVAFVSTDLLVVGAPPSQILASGTSGRAYVYRRDATSGEWRIESSHRGSTPNVYPYQSDDYGTSLASDGTSTFVGAPGDGLTGAAYRIDTGDSLFRNRFDAP